jgi:hypothetical protein
MTTSEYAQRLWNSLRIARAVSILTNYSMKSTFAPRLQNHGARSKKVVGRHTNK